MSLPYAAYNFVCSPGLCYCGGTLMCPTVFVVLPSLKVGSRDGTSLALFVPCALNLRPPPPVAHLKSRSKIEAADVLGLALAKPKHPSHVWSRKQSQGGRRAFGETVWQQNPSSRRYFWESSYRVKAADSALGAKSQIKVADVVLGLGDISVREVATVTPFAVDGAHSLGFAWRGPF